MSEDFVDYYTILESERTTSYVDLKKNYQRLLLQFHPDKSRTQKSEEKFLLLQRAWSMLRDPERRKQFDALLVCHEHSDLLLYEVISLSEMTFDQNESGYLYPCRCSGMYFLDTSDVFPPKVIVGCNECTFSIQVNIPPHDNKHKNKTSET